MNQSIRIAFTAVVALLATTVSARSPSVLLPSPGLYAEPLVMVRGQAEIRSYAVTPGTIILGDDAVVAANVSGEDVLVLTALAQGVTNVIVLDPAGVELERFLLRVTEPGGDVAVRRGVARELLRCDPLCRPLKEAEAAPRVEAAGGATEGSEAVVAAPAE